MKKTTIVVGAVILMAVMISKTDFIASVKEAKESVSSKVEEKKTGTGMISFQVKKVTVSDNETKG